MAEVVNLNRGLVKGNFMSPRVTGPSQTSSVSGLSCDSLAVHRKHGRRAFSDRSSKFSGKSFSKGRLRLDKLQCSIPSEAHSPLSAGCAPLKSSCSRAESFRHRVGLCSEVGFLRRKRRNNKGRSEEHVTAATHSDGDCTKKAEEDSHRKTHPLAPTVLYSVAALPSLTTALHPSLALSNFAVHMEFKVPDLGVAVLTAAAALVWVRLFDELARRNVFERKLSRKLVHISSGLLFMLFWPIFSSDPSSRWFAALVPATNLLRLAAVGTGVVKNEDTVKAISREGDRRELLRGPLYYVMVLIAATLCFWRQSPIGVSALALMCAGDGIADIIGRRFGGSARLPYNKLKSWAGSLAMFLTGTVTSLLYISYFCNFGFYECNMMHTALKVATIALAATIVESLPITDTLDDNVTVPLTCVAVGSLLFPA